MDLTRSRISGPPVVEVLPSLNPASLAVFLFPALSSCSSQSPPLPITLSPSSNSLMPMRILLYSLPCTLPLAFGLSLTHSYNKSSPLSIPWSFMLLVFTVTLKHLGEA